MAWLALLVVVVAVTYRMTTPDERQRYLKTAIAVLRELIAAAREEHAALKPFRAALRARTSMVLLTPALVVMHVAIFLFMLFGAGAMSDPATLVGWGANLGPRTTNGEWWRLVASTFVHPGVLRMVVEVVVLAQLGMFLERLVGPLSVAAVYGSAAALAGLVNLSAYPMAVTAGASGAIFGLYGLLFAAIVRGSLRSSRDPVGEDDERDAGTVVVPRAALIWLIPGAVMFIVSALSNDGFTFNANMAGLLVGLVGGFVLTGGITDHPPSPRRVLVTTAVALVLLVARAVPMRGIADIRPEISRIIALEDKTTGAYQAALDRFKKGSMSTEALAQFIERTIVPELDAADVHLRSIRGVPPEHQPLVAGAEEYLRLRSTSWRLYAEGWRNADRVPRREQRDVLSDAKWRMQVDALFRKNAATRGKAEGTQSASLQALQRIKLSSE